MRVPLALGVEPWATLFAFPDGRLLWCLRLWEGEEGPVPRCLGTDRLLAYARASGLPELAAAVDRLVRAALEADVRA